MGFRDRSDTAASNSYKLLDGVINTKGKLTLLLLRLKPIEFNGSFGSLRTMINKKDMDVALMYTNSWPMENIFFSAHTWQGQYTKDRSKQRAVAR